MSDSQIPDYNKPWCPKCRAHIEYKSITTNHRSIEGGSFSVVNHYCVDCHGKVGNPIENVFCLVNTSLMIFFKKDM